MRGEYLKKAKKIGVLYHAKRCKNNDELREFVEKWEEMDDEERNVRKLTVPKLRKCAAELGIRDPYGRNKDDLVNKIISARKHVGICDESSDNNQSVTPDGYAPTKDQDNDQGDNSTNTSSICSEDSECSEYSEAKRNVKHSELIITNPRQQNSHTYEKAGKIIRIVGVGGVLVGVIAVLCKTFNASKIKFITDKCYGKFELQSLDLKKEDVEVVSHKKCEAFDPCKYGLSHDECFKALCKERREVRKKPDMLSFD